MKTLYMLTKQALTAFFSSGPKTISRQDDRFEPALQAIHQEDDEALMLAIAPLQVLSAHFQIKDDDLYYQGEKLHEYFARKAMEMYREGLSIQHLLAFRERLEQNPSRRAVQELYGFLEKGKLSITEDGCFLAYKTVNYDYRDWHTGTVDNHVGQTPTMSRNKVSDNVDEPCAIGFHVCSVDYLKGFHWGEGHLMIVKVDPADVVRIPACDVTKAGVCRYEVLSEISYDEV